jgi:two-component system CheB/CheR fusion protein
LRIERIDLGRLVEDLTESVRPQAAEKHQHLATQLPPDPIWVECDPIRLQQVVSNLLVNGIRYTGPGGYVFVELEIRSGDVVVTISDTGQGISADVLPRIFDPFTRGDDASDAGLGVGLTIARQLVELHGGTISASSAGPGLGSAFVVTLPTKLPRYRRGEHSEPATGMALIRRAG